MFFEVFGRSAEQGEYSYLLRQLRWKRKPELLVIGVFRLFMRDGSPIVVSATRGHSLLLKTVLPRDWKIGDRVPVNRAELRRAIARRAADEPAAAPPIVAAKVPAQPEPAPPPKARKPATLSLSGKASEVASTVLADRLRRFG